MIQALACLRMPCLKHCVHAGGWIIHAQSGQIVMCLVLRLGILLAFKGRPKRRKPLSHCGGVFFGPVSCLGPPNIGFLLLSQEQLILAPRLQRKGDSEPPILAMSSGKSTSWWFLASFAILATSGTPETNGQAGQKPNRSGSEHPIQSDQNRKPIKWVVNSPKPRWDPTAWTTAI